MSQEALRVEFRVNLGKQLPTPKPAPGADAKRLRADRAARKARNLALAYWVDGLIRNGEAADLAAVAKMCHVSRARVSQLIAVLATTTLDQESMVHQGAPETAGYGGQCRQLPPSASVEG